MYPVSKSCGYRETFRRQGSPGRKIEDQEEMREWVSRHKKCVTGLMLFGIAFLCCLLPRQTVSAASPYYGITIDGDFSDWAGVQKYPGANGVNQVAFVFDGDYLYIYIDEPTQAFSATWSGTHSNGKFTIVTDLGYETLFQLTQENGGSVAGVEGAICAHSDVTWGLPGYYWEIAIPAANLGPYNATVSFGHYLADSLFVRDVANISGGGSEGGGENGGNPGESGGGTLPENPAPGGTFNGVVYDGSYDDWLYYPHNVLHWATAGTQENVPDAEAALYSVDGILYGHAVTFMNERLQEAGGEFTSGVSIRVNEDMNYCFYPMMVTVDGSGKINYDPQRSGLPYGTYEFYLLDTQGWAAAEYIWQLTDPSDPLIYGTNGVYGKMMVTVGPSKDEMEFWLDLSMIASKFKMETDSVKTVAAQFARLGGGWVITAGTTTGPLLGLGLCVSVVACGMIRRKQANGGKTV